MTSTSSLREFLPITSSYGGLNAMELAIVDRLKRQPASQPPFAIVAAVTVLCMVIAASLSGCTEPPAPPRATSFAACVESVRRGETDAIHVQDVAVTDQQMQQLNGVTGLVQLELERGAIHDAGVEALQAATQLDLLKLRHSPITDRGLQVIGGLEALRVLNLPHARFTDEGLTHLSNLPRLELLRFHSPNVTDDGLATISKMPQLRFLHLIDVPLTDRGLDHLMTMENLESLYIDGADLSKDAIKRLYTTRPKLHVHFDQRHHDLDPHPDKH